MLLWQGLLQRLWFRQFVQLLELQFWSPTVISKPLLISALTDIWTFDKNRLIFSFKRKTNKTVLEMERDLTNSLKTEPRVFERIHTDENTFSFTTQMHQFTDNY